MKRIIGHNSGNNLLRKVVPIIAIFFISCQGFDGVFTDKATAAFKAGGAISLPKAGGGSVVGIFIDVNNDGILDGIDLNNDGIPELLFKDLQVGQSAGLDLNGDGAIDYYLTVDYQGNFFLSTQRPTGNASSGNVTVTVGANGVPTGLNTSGGTTVDDGILGQIYADTTLPTPGTNNAGGTFVGAQTVTLTCNDNVACNGIAYTTNGSTPTFTGNGTVVVGNSTTITISSTLTLRWIVRDANGNVSTPVQSAAFTITGDITAPAPGTAISFSAIGSNGLTVNWGAATDAITAQANLEYKIVKDNTATTNIDSVAEIDAKSGGDLLQDWTANITTRAVTGLTASTTYHFAVLVRDAAGNKAFYTPASQATTAADVTPPTTGTAISFASVSDTTLSVNWGAATDGVTAQVNLQYRLVKATTSAAIDSIAEVDAISGGDLLQDYTANDITQNISSLSPSTNYFFAVVVRDLAGNKALYTPTAQMTLASGHPWTARTLPSSSDWYSIAYGNGVFVAVGSGGTAAATSPDGIIWTARSLPSSGLWQSVAYGNSIFVAIRSNSAVAASSPDGINWTARTMPTSSFWGSVTYGNGVFVAVASGGTAAATSPDGITWTARTLPSSSAWEAVTFGNGVFVAIASGGAVAASSTDGISWTARTLPSSANWRSVAYGNGVFAAVVITSSVAATSPDGITWTARTLPSSADWKSVTYGNGVFVAAPINSATAATSSDGITWTARSLPSISNWQAVVYGNGVFVAIAGGPSTIAATAP